MDRDARIDRFRRRAAPRVSPERRARRARPASAAALSAWLARCKHAAARARPRGRRCGASRRCATQSRKWPHSCFERLVLRRARPADASAFAATGMIVLPVRPCAGRAAACAARARRRRRPPWRREPTTTSFCSLKGCSQETKTCACLAARESESGRRHVGDGVVQIIAARPRVTRDGLAADERQDHREVMRREGPEDVLLAPYLPEIEPVRIEILQPAEPPLAHELASASRKAG